VEGGAGALDLALLHEAEGVDVLRQDLRLHHNPRVSVHVLIPVASASASASASISIIHIL
jgi:hypothetical protein